MANFDHPSIESDEYQLYRFVFVEWHKILRLVSNSPLRNLGAIIFNQPQLSHAPTQESENQFNYIQSETQVMMTTTANIYHHHHHEVK